MLATCHLRQFSGWMTLTKPHIFKVRDQTHPRQLLDPAVLESAAHCRSDRQELEFVNAMHARPKATFAAIGLTGFRSTPCSNIRSRCGGSWCHFDYIWFCLYIYLYSTFFKNSKPHKFWVQVWNTSESFQWSLLICLERSVEVEASLIIYGILSTAETKRLSLGGARLMPTPRGTWKNIRMFWEPESRSPENFGTRRSF